MWGVQGNRWGGEIVRIVEVPEKVFVCPCWQCFCAVQHAKNACLPVCPLPPSSCHVSLPIILPSSICPHVVVRIECKSRQCFMAKTCTTLVSQVARLAGSHITMCVCAKMQRRKKTVRGKCWHTRKCQATLFPTEAMPAFLRSCHLAFSSWCVLSCPSCLQPKCLTCHKQKCLPEER